MCDYGLQAAKTTACQKSMTKLTVHQFGCRHEKLRCIRRCEPWRFACWPGPSCPLRRRLGDRAQFRSSNVLSDARPRSFARSSRVKPTVHHDALEFPDVDHCYNVPGGRPDEQRFYAQLPEAGAVRLKDTEDQKGPSVSPKSLEPIRCLGLRGSKKKKSRPMIGTFKFDLRKKMKRQQDSELMLLVARLDLSRQDAVLVDVPIADPLAGILIAAGDAFAPVCRQTRSARGRFLSHPRRSIARSTSKSGS